MINMDSGRRFVFFMLCLIYLIKFTRAGKCNLVGYNYFYFFYL